MSRDACQKTPVSGVAATISGTVAVTGPLTDTELRASAVPVSGPLTDTELRASAVPVSGPLTDTELRATAVPISGALTDTELRATPVPVSGTVTASGPLTDTELRASAVPVSGPLTNTELRASAVPVTGPLTSSQYGVTPGASKKVYGYQAVHAQGTTSAPADAASLASLTMTFAGTGNDIICHVASDETPGAGGLVDLVIRNAGDTSDIEILASVPASGGRIEMHAVQSSATYILRLRKVGNATASTTYKAHIQHIRCAV